MAISLQERNAAIDALWAAQERLVDTDTGEVTDEEKHAALDAALAAAEVDREEHALYVGTRVLEAELEAAALDEHCKKVKERADIIRNAANRDRAYLEHALEQGEKLKNSAVSLSWRKSERVDVPNDEQVPDLYRKYSWKVDRASLKAACKRGERFDFAELETRWNLQVK